MNQSAVVKCTRSPLVSDSKVRNQSLQKMANGSGRSIDYLRRSSHVQWSDEDLVSQWLRNAFDGPNGDRKRCTSVA
jgi:hypothetical protein